MTAAVRVVVVEDSPVQRAHLVDVLQAERDIAVIGQAGDPGAFQELLDCVTVQESGFFRQGRQDARRAYAAALAALERCDQGAVEAGLDGWRAGGLAGVLRAKLGRTAGGDRP